MGIPPVPYIEGAPKATGRNIERRPTANGGNRQRIDVQTQIADAGWTLEVFKLIREINDAGVTILLVEQDVYQTLRVAVNAFVLETGRITMEGPGKELMKEESIKKAYLGL